MGVRPAIDGSAVSLPIGQEGLRQIQHVQPPASQFLVEGLDRRIHPHRIRTLHRPVRKDHDLGRHRDHQQRDPRFRQPLVKTHDRGQGVRLLRVGRPTHLRRGFAPKLLMTHKPQLVGQEQPPVQARYRQSLGHIGHLRNPRPKCRRLVGIRRSPRPRTPET